MAFNIKAVFSNFYSFIRSVFDRARPGLEDFLRKHQAEATKIIVDLASSLYRGQPLGSWKDIARRAVRGYLQQVGVPNAPDNWVEGLIFFAYEVVKKNESN